MKFNRKSWVKVSHNNLVEFINGLERTLYLYELENDYPETILEKIILEIESAEAIADLEMFQKIIEKEGLELV